MAGGVWGMCGRKEKFSRKRVRKDDQGGGGIEKRGTIGVKGKERERESRVRREGHPSAPKIQDGGVALVRGDGRVQVRGRGGGMREGGAEKRMVQG